MKNIKIYKDTHSTYETVYLEDDKVVKITGGIFEHDLIKFIKDFFNNRQPYEKITLNERSKEL